MTANGELDPISHVVERVDHRQVAFARDAEDPFDPMAEQALNQNLAAAARQHHLAFHQRGSTYR